MQFRTNDHHPAAPEASCDALPGLRPGGPKLSVWLTISVHRLCSGGGGVTGGGIARSGDRLFSPVHGRSRNSSHCSVSKDLGGWCWPGVSLCPGLADAAGCCSVCRQTGQAARGGCCQTEAKPLLPRCSGYLSTEGVSGQTVGIGAREVDTLCFLHAVHAEKNPARWPARQHLHGSHFPSWCMRTQVCG